jgi:hypothetical protein
MTKIRAWPVKVMYMLMAAALAISLIIIAAPTLKVDAADNDAEAKWEKVSTPTMKGLVLGPESIIIDYAVASDGEVAYAIVDGQYLREGEYESDYWLLKSENGAATWDDLNDQLEKLLDEDDYIIELLQVATDGDDPDFLAVALWWHDDSEGEDLLSVFISDDGGVTFDDDPGEVEDSGDYLDVVFDLAISPADDDERDIAIAGKGDALIFRCHVDGGAAGGWENAADYDGWDDDGAFTSEAVTDIQFSPDWDRDHTILVITVTGDGPGEDVYMQSGTWGTVEGWNADTGFSDALLVVGNKDIPLDELDGFVAGITLPIDYSGKTTNMRYAWVWVNWYDSGDPAATIFKVNDDDADPVGPMGQIEDGLIWLTNVSYLGYISEGKAIAGVLGDGMGDDADCCEGVQVYRNDGIAKMDICCIPWEEACKPPTGVWAMEAFYVSDDPGESQAYAVALWGFPDYDEGAWSVSFDDGDVWNQLSLIDTYIDYLSDVAVSPDCNKTMAVSVNLDSGCGCDSVWLYAGSLPEAEEYSEYWLRTWCGQLGDEQYGLLRLPADETTGETVYLVDRGTDTMYLNEMETLACWDPVSSGPREIDKIVDMAVKDAETIYVLNDDGYVAIMDAEDWREAVESEVDNGWTIAVWGDDILVGGQDGKVSHSDDDGETFTELEEKPKIDGYVTVAFDSYFDTNDTIYAAVIEECPSVSGRVYRWIIGESTKWKDLGAEPYGYTGLVLDRPDPGNPKTSADTGGVLYASYITEEAGKLVTGVARYLTPAEDVVCKECGDWDYLTEELTADEEAFYFMPKALKICGCLDETTSSKLFAIDGLGDYDMEEAKDGTVWMFEDCYAKKAPEITGPEDGDIIDADPCECFNRPFTISWNRLCDACVYDIEFALDEEFTSLVSKACAYNFTPSAGDAPAYEVPGVLVCEFTYYYQVRTIEAGTGQIIRSWWSEPQSVTIAPSLESAKIELNSPAPGAQGVPTKNVGFSWSLAAAADSFDWVLNKNGAEVASAPGLTDTYHQCTETLEYGATYTWQVTAYNAEDIIISRSDVGTFYTAVQGEFCCSICGLCFETQQELEDHIADAHPIEPTTPTWVWVVIAIGAVLVIVVIVLIFRTRRV